jgi:transposase
MLGREEFVDTFRDQLVRAARAAHVEWGYTLKEIGKFLGVHYATVSRMVERAERELLHCKT